MTSANAPTAVTSHLTTTTAALQLRKQVALGARVLSIGGHDDFNQGQVSGRVPNASDCWIKSAMIGFDECRPADVISCPLDPNERAPSAAPPELPLHQAILARRPDVRAVVHSHAPHTLVFGALGIPLRALSHEGAYFEGRLPTFDLTSDTILDYATADAVATSLAENPAVLLQNHGAVVVGKTMRHAVVGALLLERACQLQLLAMSTSQPFISSNVGDIARKRSFIYDDLSVRSYWDYSVRRIAARWTEVASW